MKTGKSMKVYMENLMEGLRNNGNAIEAERRAQKLRAISQRAYTTRDVLRYSKKGSNS